MDKLRIVTLVDNTSGGPDLLAEHGLAFWIEAGSTRVLFDTGGGKVLRANAKRLGIPLETAGAIALSHGHNDHTGGLAEALSLMPKPMVYAHPASLQPRFVRYHDRTVHEIGMPAEARAVLERAHLHAVEAPTAIGNGLRLTGPIPRVTDFEDTGGAFYTDAACTQIDELPDDQAAFIETAVGTIVILGCAHAGVVNTLRYIQSLTNNQTIHTVIGGMHLIDASPERLAGTASNLRNMGVQQLLPGHCTGFQAMARLWDEFLGRCAPCVVGTVLELPR